VKRNIMETARSEIIAALAEVFREHGFHGASLDLISRRTGLGKGSLYHAFPGGKEQMAAEVLTNIDAWFEQNVFAPLRDDVKPLRAIAKTLNAVDDYFRSGRRACLVGIFALGSERDQFFSQVQGYFDRWNAALAHALRSASVPEREATLLAEETVSGIQGALVLSRALNEPAVFTRTIKRLRARLQNAAGDGTQESSRATVRKR
jgi:AcrR family transcriptional regulator